MATVLIGRVLSSATDSVTCVQGTSPWVVSSAQLPAALVGGRLDTNIGAWLGSTAPTVGQKAMAASLPVVIASDQSAVPVSGTVAVTQSTSPWVVSTAQLPAALVGGRLDTNIGAWLGSTAPTVGQKTSADSIPVVLASDQSVVAVRQSSTTGTKTNVAAAMADTLLLASNANRRGASITNDSSTATLYVSCSTVAASLTSFSAVMLPGGSSYFEVPAGYTGEIRGIWSAAVGDARVTEYT